MGAITIIVTVMRTESVVCVVARLNALVLVAEFMRFLSEAAWLMYCHNVNCNVYSLLSETSSNVSWNEFHWLTAEKIATVAKIGFATGKIIRAKSVRTPAPSISAAWCSSSGMDSMKVLVRTIKKGETIVGNI